jgi:pimeloyl-ACP methyl ester carboxylesterase
MPKFSYIDTPLGQLHIAEEGSGDVLLLLHQTPRSWDEFREVIPLLSDRFHVIAMDMYGFGQSQKFPSPHSIDDYADGVAALVDALKLSEINLMGHHTGALVAFAFTARFPHVVKNLVLSAAPFTGAEYRRHSAGGEGVDDAVIKEDGSHLTENWAKRYPFYPKNRPDLLNRYIHDSLSAGLDPVEGHFACARYEIEKGLSQITCPVLLIGASEDPFSLPHVDRFYNSLPNSARIEKIIIEGGMIPLMEQKSSEIAPAVKSFLEKGRHE